MLNELVFVGGAITGLLITDAAAAEPRVTLDVDAIAEIASYKEYARFGDRLRALGFTEDMRDQAPTCRWIRDGAILDVMPLDESILGFSNRWYSGAVATAISQKLGDNLEIRLVTAPYFIATKLEAFKGRGNGDFLGSHDLEDLVCVVDGRDAICEEIQQQDSSLVEYLRAEFRSLMEMEGFVDALPGYLLPDATTQGRLGIVLRRLRAIAAV